MPLNMEQIQQQLDVLLHDHSEQNRLYYEVFYDPEPRDVEMEIYVDGVLTTVTIPNRAKLTRWYQSMHVPARNSILYGRIDALGAPAHLILSGGAVELDASPTMLLLNFAAGMAETGPVDHIAMVAEDHIWSGLPVSSTCWLYAQRNPSTGAITFGHTVLEPVTAKIAPAAPAEGQHWYDSRAGRMLVFSGGAWGEVQRVFLGFCVTNGSGAVTSVSPAAMGETLTVQAWLAGLQPSHHYTLDGVTDIPGIYAAATGEFTPPAGARVLEFHLVGAGGGGNVSAVRNNTCGGASGAACLVRAVPAPGDTYLVQIGAGGAGSATETGGDGGDTVVTGPTWNATAGGGQGGAATSDRAGGAVTCAGIEPVWALSGGRARSALEVDTSGGVEQWFAMGAHAPGVAAEPLQNYLSAAVGQGGIGNSYTTGRAGGPGVVYVTVYS